MSNEEEQIPMMKLTFKTTQASHTLELPEDVTVEKVKEMLATKLNHPKDRVTLIFSGKILKDPDTVASYGIKDGLVVHMVLRAGSNQPTSAPPASTTTPASHNSFLITCPFQTATASTTSNTQSSPLASLFGSGTAGLGSQQLLNNPDVMREIINQPLMQNMLSNPEIMRSLIADNPQIQNIIQV
jgi:ubiquilin